MDAGRRTGAILVTGVTKLPAMPDPVVLANEKPSAAGEKSKLSRRSQQQFRAFFLGLSLAVLSVVGCIYLATPMLVHQITTADAEDHSLRWLKSIEKIADLPGTAASHNTSYLSLLHAFFGGRSSGKAANIKLDDPSLFRQGESMAVLKGYTIFEALDQPVFSGGQPETGKHSRKDHVQNYFRAIKKRHPLTIETEPNNELHSTDTVIDKSGSVSKLTIYVPLVRGIQTTGLAVLDFERSGLENAITHALQRGALLMAAVVSFGAFLFIWLLKSFALHRDVAENEAHFLAYMDTLTRLPNRRSFKEKLPIWMEEVSQLSGGGLICLDIDRFKEVNDFHGHPIGDRYLKEFAQRIKSAAEGHLVFRLSGDEFTILVKNRHGSDDVKKVSKAIEFACSRSVKLDGAVLDVVVSMGVALCPNHSEDPEELMRYADLALYEAKEKPNISTVFFNPSLSRRLRRKTFVLELVSKAVANHTLVTFFQPQVDVSKGIITGCEALVRLPDTINEFVSPAEFIPLAEANGLIEPLGQQVLKAACEQALEWPGEERVAVNVSPIQLRNNKFPQIVQDILEETGLPAERLELEITEGVFLRGEEEVLDQLHQLRAMGVGLALDDFGTGFSSLNYLTRLPLTKIKIDRSFIIKMLDDPIAAAIIQSVIKIGHSMNADVIAEGVEEHAQVKFLDELGCYSVQGYLFGKPSENPFEGANEVRNQIEKLEALLAG